MSMISLRRSRHFTIIYICYHLGSQSIFAWCPAPFSEFPYFLWKVPGISDTDFPGHFHIQSHPLLRRIYTNQDLRRMTEIPKIHFKETVLPISQILAAHTHYEVTWPQLILTEVAIAGDIWSKYPSLGLLLMPWSFTSYFMRDHQSDQPDHLSDHWSVINHTSYLSFFLHEQKFWRIKFTPKESVNYDKMHRKLPIFCAITAKYTVNCQFFALDL